MEKIRRSARWSGRFLYRAFEIFSLLVSSWILLAILLPEIRVNTIPAKAQRPVEIFIRSNGVHTDFVLPVHHTLFAWDTFIAPHVCNADSTYQYIALGWGDKGFFLNTPTWDDLTFATAFTAASGIGGTAMHVDYMRSPPKTGPRGKQFLLTEKQYAALIAYITQSFTLSNAKPVLIDHAGYGQRDKFFEANGRYSLFMTCNEWTGDGMQAAEMPVGIWTPLESGIMQAR
jgi:uncharacterized protein (TIGR02117 family)